MMNSKNNNKQNKLNTVSNACKVNCKEWQSIIRQICIKRSNVCCFLVFVSLIIKVCQSARREFWL